MSVRPSVIVVFSGVAVDQIYAPPGSGAAVNPPESAASRSGPRWEELRQQARRWSLASYGLATLLAVDGAFDIALQLWLAMTLPSFGRVGLLLKMAALRNTPSVVGAVAFLLIGRAYARLSVKSSALRPPIDTGTALGELAATQRRGSVLIAVYLVVWLVMWTVRYVIPVGTL